MFNVTSNNKKNLPSNCNAVSSAWTYLTSVRSSQAVAPKRIVAEELRHPTAVPAAKTNPET
jgi:hypothetical protein